MIYIPLWVLTTLVFLLVALFCTSVYYHAGTKYLEKARAIKKSNSARRAATVKRCTEIIEADVWGCPGSRDQIDRVSEQLRIIRSNVEHI